MGTRHHPESKLRPYQPSCETNNWNYTDLRVFAPADQNTLKCTGNSKLMELPSQAQLDSCATDAPAEAGATAKIQDKVRRSSLISTSSKILGKPPAVPGRPRPRFRIVPVSLQRQRQDPVALREATIGSKLPCISIDLMSRRRCSSGVRRSSSTSPPAGLPDVVEVRPSSLLQRSFRSLSPPAAVS